MWRAFATFSFKKPDQMPKMSIVGCADDGAPDFLLPYETYLGHAAQMVGECGAGKAHGFLYLADRRAFVAVLYQKAIYRQAMRVSQLCQTCCNDIMFHGGSYPCSFPWLWIMVDCCSICNEDLLILDL